MSYLKIQDSHCIVWSVVTIKITSSFQKAALQLISVPVLLIEQLSPIVHVREQKNVEKTARHLHKSIHLCRHHLSECKIPMIRIVSQCEREARVNHFHNNSVRPSVDVHPSLFWSMCFLMCARARWKSRDEELQLHALSTALSAAAAAAAEFSLSDECNAGKCMRVTFGDACTRATHTPWGGCERWQNVRARRDKNAAAAATLSLSHLSDAKSGR